MTGSARRAVTLLTHLPLVAVGSPLVRPRRRLPRSAPVRPLLALLTALACALPSHPQALRSAPPTPLGFSAERLERLSTVAQRSVDSGAVAGAVLLVMRHGQVAYRRAFGWADKEAGRRMTPDAIFRIASQTKAITSVGIMMLVEEGRLQLGDSVGRYLPEFQRTTVAVPRDSGGYDVVAAMRQITIRDLLTHTAGLGYGSGPAASRWAAAKLFHDRAEPLAAIVARLATLPFDAHPGERFVYGYATDVLGAVIERVAGLPLDEFLRVRLFEPLGMRDTHFYLPPGKRERLAAVYAPRPGGGVERLGNQGAFEEPRRNFSGGGGLLSTASDYARFLQMLLNGGVLEGHRIVSPRTVALMTTDHVGTSFPERGAGFGLGFRVLEEPGAAGVYGSRGAFDWGGLWGTWSWVDPADDLVGICMLQMEWREGLGGLRLCRHKFRSLVYQALVDAAPVRQ